MSLQKWMHILVCKLIILLKTGSIEVNITYLDSAVTNLAVCLDGSLPAYYFNEGVGEGTNNWLVHMEGGAWCHNATTCTERKNTELGSSTQMPKQLTFSGIFSNKSKYNPHFYDWNRIRIGYCDGASFTGDTVDNVTNLQYRGARIFDAVMKNLLAKGMENATNALLSGSSAGGLASIIHCDNFAGLFNVSLVKVKCLSDAGFFINTKDISNASYIESYFNDVVETHGSAMNLPQSCTSNMRAGLCFFPENIVQYMKTDLFVVNSADDGWQITNSLATSAADPNGEWDDCKNDIVKCNTTQLQTIQDFHTRFINVSTKALDASATASNGYFINSCYAHIQIETQDTWLSTGSPELNQTKIGQAVGGWFHNGSQFKLVDCDYPCDNSCLNRVDGLPDDVGNFESSQHEIHLLLPATEINTFKFLELAIHLTYSVHRLDCG